MVLLAGALLLALPACEYPGVPHPLAAQVEGKGSSGPPAQAAPAPGKEPPASGQNPGQSSPGPAVLQGTVTVALKDFKLDPDQLTVKQGAVTFVLKNEGRYTHDFRVEGQGLDEKAPKVGQGRTSEWQIDLSPGAYKISCPISNHADRGMNGELTVVP
ncbi:MAG: cupredoxin domain-containing protein [Chloroflexi bacterium]|nr:cupredoxin domain-containing protein [Chloroflexota bacterium]